MSYFEIAKEKFEALRTQKDVLILSIESSCDETSVALVRNGREVLANVTNTQIEIHKQFGGVVPEVASRNHIKNIDAVLQEALKVAGKTLADIDAVAVTFGAGLIGALLVGVNFAKTLAYALKLPLIAISHVHGHVGANYISHLDLTPPFLCLMVSGGHTALVQVEDYCKFNLIGSTVDDSVGECFDKVARVLGLSYPGGPNIDKLAKEFKECHFQQSSVRCLCEAKGDFWNCDELKQSALARKTPKSAEKNTETAFNLAEIAKDFAKKCKYSAPLKNTFNFSFSGLKTAVVNFVHNATQKGEEICKEEIAFAFQELVTDELVGKTMRACEKLDAKKLVVAGGVGANSALREKLQNCATKQGVKVFMPELKYCTDNAAMIGAIAFYYLQAGQGLADLTLTAKPTMAI